jgi:glycosyltransferase involved in cell wall biosynthesis
MRIAVNTRLITEDQLEEEGYFTKEIFFRLAEQHPEHQFLFFFDRPVSATLSFPHNVTPVVIRPKAYNTLSVRWWFDVKVSLALRRHKADVFISPDGFCSLVTKVPQVLVIKDLIFLHCPQFVPKLRLLFHKRFTARYVAKAKVVATLSEFTKQDIITQYGVPAEKIINVSSAAKAVFKPIEWEEKEQVKEKYAEGCEYFVFVGGANPKRNLMNLLKAFSLFKKRQHTTMKLVVVGAIATDDKDTFEKLETYKFRSAVKLPGNLPDDLLAKVIAGAYALVFPDYFEGFALPVLQAMQSNVPVITSNVSSMPELGGEAALYAEPDDPSDIADQMKLIFKDENLRSRLVKQGETNAANYSWQRSVELMWSAIQQAVSK